MSQTSPEECAIGRQVRTVSDAKGMEQVYYNGGDLVVRMSNTRNDFEVLITADRSADFLKAAASSDCVELTGFWRRRSGTKTSGSRGYIWCLVLISWSVGGRQALAA